MQISRGGHVVGEIGLGISSFRAYEMTQFTVPTYYERCVHSGTNKMNLYSNYPVSQSYSADNIVHIIFGAVDGMEPSLGLVLLE